MKYIAYLSLSLLLLGCSESQMFLKSLDKYRPPIDYLHDTRAAECDKHAAISLGSFENQALDSATSVATINHKLLPFIIYNYEETSLAVRLGQNSIEQSYINFVKESFRKESEKTGCYSLIDDSGNSTGYVIEIRFDTCETTSRYQMNSTLVFVGIAFGACTQEMGFPAETNLIVNVKLVKADKPVFQKRYSIIRTQPFINGQTRNVENLRADFVTNMVESLSLSTKECIEQIIKDINLMITHG